MFDDWKQAWREAVENFKREAAGSEAGTPLRIRAMERELVSAGGALNRLEREIVLTRREAEKERNAVLVCRRREGLARDVGDEETVRVAIEYAERHEQRAELLERKATVLDDERALLERDVADMQRILTEAGAATQTVSSGGTAAQQQLDDRAFSRLEHDARERAADEKLEELKRRMRG